MMCSYAINQFTESIQASFDADLTHFVESRKNKFLCAAQALDSKPLFDALRPLYKPKAISASAVWDMHGVLTQSLRDTKQAEHFARSLDAEQCTLESLVRKDRFLNTVENAQLRIDKIDWDLCPSVASIDSSLLPTFETIHQCG